MDDLILDSEPKLPDIVLTPSKNTPRRQIQFDLPPTTQQIIVKVRDSMIGEDLTFLTPFGLKKIVYADFTASGRLSTLVQSFLQANVYPLYANTHSNSSWGPIQTAIYRDESRALIKKVIGANQEDSVIFCGSGSSCAVNKLARLLQAANRRNRFDNPGAPKMVVLLSKFEHHSNILPWREQPGIQIQLIPSGVDESFDYEMLESKLKQVREKFPMTQVIGSFSAGSNLTGHYVDVDRIAFLCHLYGALCFFDYACVAPYLDINLNGPTNTGYARQWLKKQQIPKFHKLCYKDGIFISTHKFIGGPGSSGILTVKTRLVDSNRAPVFPGGGSVIYVNEKQHIYVNAVEDREEAGTPNILGDIKAGLAFKLKHSIGVEAIKVIDNRIMKIVKARAKTMKNVTFYGSMDLPRVPIFVFNIKVFGKYLHYNFVCILLNDLFGIFSRGGCQCAGPYGHELLRVGLKQSHAIRDLIVEGHQIFKMGFSRINFSYLWDDTTINYVLDALEFISQHGWMFLPKYIPNQKTGQWMHVDGEKSYLTRESIHSFNILEESVPFQISIDKFNLTSVTESMTGILASLRNDYQRNGYQLMEQQCLKFPQGSEGQQWFLTPSQARNQMINTGLSNLKYHVAESLENEMIVRNKRASQSPSPTRIPRPVLTNSTDFETTIAESDQFDEGSTKKSAVSPKKVRENAKSWFKDHSTSTNKRKPIKARESFAGVKRIQLPKLKLRQSILTHTKSELNMPTVLRQSPITNPKQHIPKLSRNTGFLQRFSSTSSLSTIKLSNCLKYEL